MSSLIIDLLPQSTDGWRNLLESLLFFVDALLVIVEIVVEPVLSFVLVRLQRKRERSYI